MKLLSASVIVLLASAQAISIAHARGNTTNQSFNKAKKYLEREVYFDHRQTIYCAAAFDANKLVIPPKGFTTDKYVKRAKKIEWEHVVPAENFGRTFVEWRDGNSACMDSKGNDFKGRKCAEKVNFDYRYMQSDMYNLFPAIGAVNARRSNYNFTVLSNTDNSFGSCAMKIEDRKAEPPTIARGSIARAYLHMQSAYPRYKMSRQQSQLMNAWDKQYPVDQWECLRTHRIEAIQGNENTVVKARCVESKLW
jgi:deoxyribonuclease-1